MNNLLQAFGVVQLNRQFVKIMIIFVLHEHMSYEQRRYIIYGLMLRLFAICNIDHEDGMMSWCSNDHTNVFSHISDQSIELERGNESHFVRRYFSK